MLNDKLIYTNSAGQSVEFYQGGIYYTNIRTDVTGLSEVNTTLYRTTVVDMDGELETGFSVDSRSISIKGFLNNPSGRDNEASMRELIEVFSPFYTGVLRLEGEDVVEIDVRPETAPKNGDRQGSRYPGYIIKLIALNPNWRATSEKEKTIATGGTSIYYDGSRACGMEIEITALADTIDMDRFTVTNGSTVKTITFRLGGGVYLMTGDVLLLNISQTGITITLNDVNALERVEFADTDFPQLYPGNNVISWDAHGDEADFTVKVRYTPLYLAK